MSDSALAAAPQAWRWIEAANGLEGAADIDVDAKQLCEPLFRVSEAKNVDLVPSAVASTEEAPAPTGESTVAASSSTYAIGFQGLLSSAAGLLGAAFRQLEAFLTDESSRAAVAKRSELLDLFEFMRERFRKLSIVSEAGVSEEFWRLTAQTLLRLEWEAAADGVSQDGKDAETSSAASPDRVARAVARVIRRMLVDDAVRKISCVRSAVSALVRVDAVSIAAIANDAPGLVRPPPAIAGATQVPKASASMERVLESFFRHHVCWRFINFLAVQVGYAQAPLRAVVALEAAAESWLRSVSAPALEGRVEDDVNRASMCAESKVHGALLDVFPDKLVHGAPLVRFSALDPVAVGRRVQVVERRGGASTASGELSVTEDMQLFWFRFVGLTKRQADTREFAERLALHLNVQFDADIDVDILEAVLMEVVDTDRSGTVSAIEFSRFVRMMSSIRNVYAARFFCVPDIEFMRGEAARRKQERQERAKRLEMDDAEAAAHERGDKFYLANLSVRPEELHAMMGSFDPAARRLVRLAAWFKHIEPLEVNEALRRNDVSRAEMGDFARFPRFLLHRGAAPERGHVFTLSYSDIVIGHSKVLHVVKSVHAGGGVRYRLAERSGEFELLDLLLHTADVAEWRPEHRLLSKLKAAWRSVDEAYLRMVLGLDARLVERFEADFRSDEAQFRVEWGRAMPSVPDVDKVLDRIRIQHRILRRLLVAERLDEELSTMMELVEEGDSWTRFCKHSVRQSAFNLQCKLLELWKSVEPSFEQTVSPFSLANFRMQWRTVSRPFRFVDWRRAWRLLDAGRDLAVLLGAPALQLKLHSLLTARTSWLAMERACGGKDPRFGEPPLPVEVDVQAVTAAAAAAAAGGDDSGRDDCSLAESLNAESRAEWARVDADIADWVRDSEHNDESLFAVLRLCVKFFNFEVFARVLRCLLNVIIERALIRVRSETGEEKKAHEDATLASSARSQGPAPVGAIDLSLCKELCRHLVDESSPTNENIFHMIARADWVAGEEDRAEDNPYRKQRGGLFVMDVTLDKMCDTLRDALAATFRVECNDDASARWWAVLTLRVLLTMRGHRLTPFLRAAAMGHHQPLLALARCWQGFGDSLGPLHEQLPAVRRVNAMLRELNLHPLDGADDIAEHFVDDIWAQEDESERNALHFLFDPRARTGRSLAIGGASGSRSRGLLRHFPAVQPPQQQQQQQQQPQPQHQQPPQQQQQQGDALRFDGLWCRVLASTERFQRWELVNARDAKNDTPLALLLMQLRKRGGEGGATEPQYEWKTDPNDATELFCLFYTKGAVFAVARGEPELTERGDTILRAELRRLFARERELYDRGVDRLFQWLPQPLRWALLCSAVRNRDLAFVDFLLHPKLPAPIFSMRDKKGVRTVLHELCALPAEFADVIDGEDRYGARQRFRRRIKLRNPSFVPAGDRDLVNLLLRYVPSEQRNRADEQGAQLAADAVHDGKTALHLLVLNDYFEADHAAIIATAILDAKTIVDVEDDVRWTAIDYAAAKDSVEIAETLLAHGATLGGVGDSASTLHIGAYFGSERVVRLLLEKRASLKVDLEDTAGRTPLGLVLQSTGDPMYEKPVPGLHKKPPLENLEVVEALMERGARTEDLSSRVDCWTDFFPGVRKNAEQREEELRKTIGGEADISLDSKRVTNELAKTSFFANKFHQKVISAKYAEEARPRHQLRLLCYVLYVVCCSTLAVYMTTRDALGASLTRSGVIQGLVTTSYFNAPVGEFPQPPVFSFNRISSLRQFHLWLQDPVVDFFYPETPPEFWVGGERRQLARGEVGPGLRIVGRPRLRQVRSRVETCSGSGASRVCFTSGSDPQQSREPFGAFLFGALNASEHAFRDADELRGWLWTLGKAGAYGGGGFVIELPDPTFNGARNTSAAIMSEVESAQWVDARTRMVVLEFALHNPSENYFVVAQLMLEFPRGGVLVPTSQIEIQRLYYWVGAEDVALYTLGWLWLIGMLLFIFVGWCYRIEKRRAHVRAVQLRHRSMRERSTLMTGSSSEIKQGDSRGDAIAANHEEALQFLCCACVCCARPPDSIVSSTLFVVVANPLRLFFTLWLCAWLVLRAVLLGLQLHFLRSDWEGRGTLDGYGRVSQLLGWESDLISFVVFSNWMLLFKHLYAMEWLRMNRLILMLEKMGAEFFQFSVLLVVTVFAFVFAEFVCYGYASSTSFTIGHSFMAQLLGVIGGRRFDLTSEEVTNRFMGSVYAILFLVMANLLLLSLLVATLNSAYSEALQKTGDAFMAVWRLKSLKECERMAASELPLWGALWRWETALLQRIHWLRPEEPAAYETSAQRPADAVKVCMSPVEVDDLQGKGEGEERKSAQ